MPSLCSECGENAVEEDHHFSQDHKVCTNCGNVVEELSFQAEKESSACFVFSDGSYSASTVATAYHWQNRKRKSCGHKAGLKEISELCKLMKMSSELQKRSTELFEKAYNIDCFKNYMTKKKHVLNGCCVYISCRQENWPVTIAFICDLIQCSRQDFNSVYKSLLSQLDIQITSVCVEDVVKHLLNKFGFEEPEFVNKTMKVLQLAKDAWISSGRAAEPVATAAVYIVWKSQINVSVKNVGFKNFCAVHGIGSYCNILKKVKEIQQTLLILAHQIPWVDNKMVTQKNISSYLNEILNYEKSLKSRALEAHASESADDVLDEPKMIFEPPCYKKRKREAEPIHVEPDCISVSSSPELTELDIPDSEMDQYLKTPEEVAMCSNMYEMMYGTPNDK
ncbi:transcription factor IIIB 50 kDa subunit-like [Saccoglossus kowalevskii]|uniref:Transcription factor IIIB 50 kDa subunit-like n=1 Tax=Saccoglossus kowalevskii TaxID=10224 RepID=A0ABM0GQ93_SACKO|nr:PREDICTED: transcription factor IIIB 50 kDa subunit-like [Saccoglossus kowalevskii]